MYKCTHIIYFISFGILNYYMHDFNWSFESLFCTCNSSKQSIWPESKGKLNQYPTWHERSLQSITVVCFDCGSSILTSQTKHIERRFWQESFWCALQPAQSTRVSRGRAKDNTGRDSPDSFQQSPEIRGETRCDLNKQRRALEVAVTLLGCITESILGRHKEWLLYLLCIQFELTILDIH